MSQQEQTKKKPVKKEELSEQDQELKTQIDELVSSIITTQRGLDAIKNLVRTSTTSMTSVPKPFKFLKDHFTVLVEFYEKQEVSLFKKELADFLSVLAMVYSKPEDRFPLRYLQEGTMKEFKEWGHEYLSRLSADIGLEYQQRMEQQMGADDLLELVTQIVPRFMEHNQEHDAIDLLMEVDRLDQLAGFITPTNTQRILQYLLSTAPYTSDQDELEQVLQTSLTISLKQKEYTHAMRIALRIDRPGLVERVFSECQDPIIRKQLAFAYARARYLPDQQIQSDPELFKIASNSLLSSFYVHLAKDLEALEPKTPEQICKTHLEEHKHGQNIDSAKANLAQTYVNAFVNAGFKKDALMMKKDDPWVNKVKNEGKIAAVASIGLTNIWNSDNGPNEISEYLELSDIYSKSGGCLGIGICCTGLVDESDPAIALLSDYLDDKEEQVRIGAVMGVGIAYAGSNREDLLERLIPIVVDTNLSIELSSLAALSLGLIYVGKCKEEVSCAIIQTLAERADSFLSVSMARFFALGLGLLFLGQQERCDATIEALGMVSHPISKYASITITSLAYSSSGNVLKVQELLGQCLEHLKDAKDSDWQQVAVLGIALVAGSEDIGNEMAHRLMNHILHYCDLNVKRAVPLAIALLNISTPKIAPMDLLLKLSHDPDPELSFRAILCLGILGAGSNNSRIADLLHGLSVYVGKDPNGMFLIRIAQGLLHMGKGLLTLQPYYSDRFLLNKVAMAGIMVFMHSCLDTTNLLLGKNHTLFYYLTLAMYPRMFFTLDEKLQNLQVSVRVGQAVDAVGQAGKPKRITGFQTHTSPVMISTGERAELAIDEYIPIQDCVLENFVILKKNPDYVPEIEQTKKKQN